MNVKIYVDTTGEVVARFSAKEWQDWINEFIDEKSYLLTSKRKTIKDEADWISETINKMNKQLLIKIIAVDEAKNKLVGVCDVKRLTPLESLGHNVSFGLGVKEEYRRKGIGTALLKEAIRVAKEIFKAKNMWIEYVEGNVAARNLYIKMGFVELFTGVGLWLTPSGKVASEIKQLFK